MSVTNPESELPSRLSVAAAVEAAYSQALARTAWGLVWSLPVLIECDKELMPFLFMNLRNRLRQSNLRCLFFDGRTLPEVQQVPQGMIATMIGQLRDAVRGSVEQKVVVIPHLDLLATSQGGLTSDAKEVVALLYENPE